MSDSVGPDAPPTLPIVAVAIPLMVCLAPYLFVLYKYPAHREWVLATFGCRACCSRRIRYDAADLQVIRELQEPSPRPNVGINGAYRSYLARSKLALRLTTWREDVQKLSVTENPQFKLPNTQSAQDEDVRPLSHASATAGDNSLDASATSSPFDLPLDVVVVVINNQSQEPGRPTALSFEGETGYEPLPPTPKDQERPSMTPEGQSIVLNEGEQSGEESDRQHPRDYEAI